MNKWKDKREVVKAKYCELKSVVEKICDETRGYGKRRLSKELKRRGYKIGVKLANVLNHLWGNLFALKKANRFKSSVAKIVTDLGIKANLLRAMDLRNIEPFAVVRTDATEIIFNFGNDKVYLNTRICECSKVILASTLSRTLDTGAVIASLEKEESLRIKLGLTFEDVISHQDQGAVYTSIEYMGWLLGKDAYLSYSKRATPGDNAAKESFYGRLKNEWKETFLECRTFEELEKEIQKMVEYYNFTRLHSSIGDMPPNEFLKALGYKL